MDIEEQKLKERIRILLANKHFSVARLADNETDRVRYRRQINQDSVVPISTIVLLLSTFP